MNSDGFVFDQEIIAQAVAARFRIAEIPVPVRYFPEASSASFWRLLRLRPQDPRGWSRATCSTGPGLKRSRRLGSIAGRYSRLGRPGSPPPADAR